MQEYMNRLIKCGFHPYEASKLYQHMIKNFDLDDLELLVSSIEDEKICGYNTILIQQAEM